VASLSGAAHGYSTAPTEAVSALPRCIPSSLRQNSTASIHRLGLPKYCVTSPIIRLPSYTSCCPGTGSYAKPEPLPPDNQPIAAFAGCLPVARGTRKKGRMAPGQPWLFSGYRGQHMSARQLHRLFAWRQPAPASPSVSVFIRCSRALPPISWSKRPISGSSKFCSDTRKLDTTALYTRVAISAIGEVTSPLDLLLKMPA